MPTDLKYIEQRIKIRDLENQLDTLHDQVEEQEETIEFLSKQNRELKRHTPDWRFHPDPFREWYRRHIE